jgi:hypothetical protein
MYTTYVCSSGRFPLGCPLACSFAAIEVSSRLFVCSDRGGTCLALVPGQCYIVAYRGDPARPWPRHSRRTFITVSARCSNPTTRHEWAVFSLSFSQTLRGGEEFGVSSSVSRRNNHHNKKVRALQQSNDTRQAGKVKARGHRSHGCCRSSSQSSQQ